MLDIKFIIKNKDLVQEAINNKKIKQKPDVNQIINLYEKRNELQYSLDELKKEQNIISREFTKTENKEELLKKANKLKEEIKVKENNLNEIEEKFLDTLKQVPNVTSPKMPVGKDENENKVLEKFGDLPNFDFEIKDHVELGEKLDILDLEKASQVSGARFYYLKGDAVNLQYALINFVMQKLQDKNFITKIAEKVGTSTQIFTPVLPPVMIKPEIMEKMDRLDPIEDRFVTEQDNLVMIGSAEHTLGPLHMNEIIDVETNPVRYIGYSTSFRREAGSYGKDTKGIIRVHQFDKLEMESFSSIEMGEREQEFFVEIQKEFVKLLELPFQVIQICTGDTGKPDYNQYDIETWIPSQNKYRETHTSDFMTDYQARRLNIRYKNKEGKNKFVYMNDATAFAIPRIIVAILENYQQADGSVIVPEVLRPFMGKDKIEKK